MSSGATGSVTSRVIARYGAQAGAAESSQSDVDSSARSDLAGSIPDAATFAAVRALLRAAKRADGTPPISDQALAGAEQGKRELVLFAIGGTDSDGTDPGGTDSAGTDGNTTGTDPDAAPTLAAVGIVGSGEIDLAVHPDLRGRGIGRAALAEMLSEASLRGDNIEVDDGEDIADEDLDDQGDDIGSSTPRPASHTELRAWAHGDNPAAIALLRGADFCAARELLRMTLDPAQLPDPAAELVVPDGFSIESYDRSDSSQASEWVAVNAAAFASHAEQGKMTLEDFTTLTHEDWFDPDDLFLCYAEPGTAVSPEEPLAAYAWVKTVRQDPDHTDAGVECELYAIGVHPDYAGFGLGKVLLGRVLRRMAEHAPQRVSLYVDGDNERAVGLYLTRGFTVEQRSEQWVRG
ncbi:GNAT family N-acetyltransferase [Leucobacter sp. GX24907]